MVFLAQLQWFITETIIFIGMKCVQQRVCLKKLGIPNSNGFWYHSSHWNNGLKWRNSPHVQTYIRWGVFSWVGYQNITNRAFYCRISCHLKCLFDGVLSRHWDWFRTVTNINYRNRGFAVVSGMNWTNSSEPYPGSEEKTKKWTQV